MAAGLHAVTFVLLLNPSVNALCHWPHKWLGGYQNSRAAHAFRTSNNWIVAFLTAGEGFHNNHHDQQATARVRLDALGVGGRLGLLGRHRPARVARPRHPRAPAESERAVSRATHWPDAQAAEMFAESESVAIFRCPSGCLHFRIGPLCLTLTPQELAEVGAVVLCAMEQVQRRLAHDPAPTTERRRAPPPSPHPPSRHSAGSRYP